MTTGTENPMDALASLLDERSRYEAWIAQLDARRASTPQHVFERVRGDYATRLGRVNDQLASRATELESTAADLAARVSTLYEQEMALRDERAEAELRAMVGEYSPDQAREITDRCDAEVARLEGERGSLGAELARLQDILTQVAKPPVAAAPEQPPRAQTPPAAVAVEPAMAGAAPELPVAAPASDAAPPRAGAPASADVAAQAPAGGAPGSFDELAFLQALVQPQSAAPAAAPRPAEPVPAEPAAAPVQPASQAMGAHGAESLTTPPASPPLRRHTAPQPVQGREALRDSRLNSSLTPGTLPAFLKEMPTEQIKTLKCQECGTMNYPTEWYCERCGGELAAL